MELFVLSLYRGTTCVGFVIGTLTALVAFRHPYIDVIEARKPQPSPDPAFPGRDEATTDPRVIAGTHVAVYEDGGDPSYEGGYEFVEIRDEMHQDLIAFGM
jgi:hypothetical protein